MDQAAQKEKSPNPFKSREEEIFEEIASTPNSPQAIELLKEASSLLPRHPKTATIDCWSNFCIRTKDHALIEKWLDQENSRVQFERLLFLATTCFVDGKSSWPENEDFLTGFFSNPFCKQVWSNAAFLQKTDDFWRKMAIVFKSVPENHFARFLEKSGFQTLNSIGTNLDALIPWHAIERSVFCDPGFSLESQKKIRPDV